MGFPSGSACKESACNAGDLVLIAGLGRSPGERKGYPLQYSGMSRTQLGEFHFHFSYQADHGVLIYWLVQLHGEIPAPLSQLHSPWGSASVLAPPLCVGQPQVSVPCPGAVLSCHSVTSLCNPMDRSPPGCSVHGDFPGKNTGVGYHALLQGIFPTQGLNHGLPALLVDSLPSELSGNPQ